jgi:chaperonin GroEL (HSP60 family)
MEYTKIKELEELVTKANQEETVGVINSSMTNVVSGETLRKVQISVLEQAATFISATFGPMGSNTKIISGNDFKNIKSEYSKDGLKVLKNITFADPIEASIIEELIEITRHVEGEVGDGTTSTVILSSHIFKNLNVIQKKFNIAPYELMRKFNNVVSEIQKSIKDNGAVCTTDTMYNISMISTNGNEEVSKNIKDIYEGYGMDVDLSVGISNDSDSKIKVYDGLTITEGMSDPCFINNRQENTAEIHNARIYYFSDPVDSYDMIQLFKAIIIHNIFDKISNEEQPIPTVICCPKISRDAQNILQDLAQSLYTYDARNMESEKPPICIVTDIVASDEIIMDDIANLCGCKRIKKYIDPKMYEEGKANGTVPTVENVQDFYGEAELVVADQKKTKFINPAHMYRYDDDGNRTEDPVYTSMVQFIEQEIANNKSSEDANTLGLLRKRLSALKANMVDYLVGGITISERDAIKDLVEDAIKNCRSAAKYGVGNAANFEGLLGAYKYCEEHEEEDTVEAWIGAAIYDAYDRTLRLLYRTICRDEEVIQDMVDKSLEEGRPANIKSASDFDFDTPVLCSIMLDVEILDTISKIVSMMVTCNQCLLQAPQLNKY